MENTTQTAPTIQRRNVSLNICISDHHDKKIKEKMVLIEAQQPRPSSQATTCPCLADFSSSIVALLTTCSTQRRCSPTSKKLPISRCQLETHQLLYLKKQLEHLLELCQDNIFIKCTDNSFTLESDRTSILKGTIVNNLMQVAYSLPITLKNQVSTNLWHMQLGHPRESLPSRNLSGCVHNNLVGPIFPSSISGFQYFLTIVNQLTSKMVCLLNSKLDAFEILFIVKNLMENLHNQKLNKLVSDQGEKIRPFWKRLAVFSMAPSYQETTGPSPSSWPPCCATSSQPPVDTILVCYKNDNTSYQILHLSNRKVIISQHVTFDKNCFPPLQTTHAVQLTITWGASRMDSGLVDEFQHEDAAVVDETHSAETPAPCLNVPKALVEPHTLVEAPPQATSFIKVIGPQHPTLINSKINDQNILLFLCCPKVLLMTSDHAPQTFISALNRPASDKWSEAINQEFFSMNKLQVWDTVELEPSYKIFGISSLSQFLKWPGLLHWKALLHMLQYLWGTPGLGLVYSRGNNSGVSAYSNADWGNCSLTRRSTSGYLFLFNNCLTTWKKIKQPSVSLSKAEAEYKSLCDLASELIWLRQWATECQIHDFTQAIPFHKDDKSCINTASENFNFNNKRMKNINIQLHLIKEIVQSSQIKLIYTPTDSILANFLPKSVRKPILMPSLSQLGVLTLEVKGDVEN
ncbi:hypothetical protein O181_022644 [Austropuccinia psidii MF-1]|uniref:Retroviral polymerase SH3-like domain-containing protein n=1 Tax=Austropuccinia psidii MF-1 TaxID=1389203 RepID=A0A9Q3CF64_9BASI|nr:hypothetical protein [Austropuccinia psidii MF-1]